MRFIITLGLVLLTTVCFADNSARIKELREEAAKLLNQRQQLDVSMKQTEARLFEIQGAVNELDKQDKEADKTTVNSEK